MNIKDIKPNGQQSDKYSIQLYKYLKKHYPNGSKVYYIATQTKLEKDNNGEYYSYEAEVPLDKEHLMLGEIWIGDLRSESILDGNLDWMYGNSLDTILGCGKCKYEKFANPWNTKKTKIDITDWFWLEYIKIGRCLWDKKHGQWFRDDENRFTYKEENIRTCNWCGYMQEKKVSEIVKTEINDEWLKCES